MNERHGLIALNMMEKVGPVAFRSLLDRLGTVEAIFGADERTLLACERVGPETAGAIIRQRDCLDPAAEEERAGALGARIVTMHDAEYPTALRAIHNAPLVLYVRGRFAARDAQAVAIVGTRRPTRYGSDVASLLASGIARSKMTVVSGLAEGIDTHAHRGALDAGGRTLAVLGGALDCFFPMSNKDLAAAIEGQGAVISEFPLGRRPDRTTFPMRNRIVSGLSRAVIVVEAGRKSGALITAREAAEQGRTVMAVPGRIDVASSLGCLDLLRDGAVLVRGTDDVFEELDCLLPRPAADARESEAGSRHGLNSEELKLVGMLERGECDVDALIRTSGLQAGVVGSLLLGLEMRRVIRMLPGRMVELVNQPPALN